MRGSLSHNTPICQGRVTPASTGVKLWALMMTGMLPCFMEVVDQVVNGAVIRPVYGLCAAPLFSASLRF